MDSDSIDTAKRETHEFIMARRTPCAVCGTPLWRHIEELAGHKYEEAMNPDPTTEPTTADAPSKEDLLTWMQDAIYTAETQQWSSRIQRLIVLVGGQATRERALVAALRDEHQAFCEGTGQMGHADDIRQGVAHAYCARCALLAGQPVAQDEK